MNKLKLSCTILFLLLAQLLYCQAENASVSLEELQEIEMNLKQSSKEIKNSTKSLNEIGKKIETIRSNSEQKPASFLDIKLYDDDFIKLAFRFLINLLAILLIARTIYYPLAKRKDYLFTYIMISILVFFICFTLKKFELGLGMALGLFAIFGIIRYRTDPIPIKEMTYLFIVIGISVINALANKKMSYAELLLTNSIIVFATYGMERLWLLKHESRKVITYEKIDLIVPENHVLLKEDLEKRTGLKINRLEIGKINFLNDTAQIFIHYYADEQDGNFKDEGIRPE
tara:strand:+ start:301 stop:1158 length:858 start_codon:yes stop_codon:yes gene_type:complete